MERESKAQVKPNPFDFKLNTDDYPRQTFKLNYRKARNLSDFHRFHYQEQKNI